MATFTTGSSPLCVAGTSYGGLGPYSTTDYPEVNLWINGVKQSAWSTTNPYIWP